MRRTDSKVKEEAMNILGMILVITMIVSVGILLWMKTPRGKKWLASL